MAATILFTSLFLLSVAVFIKRNALIDGANANKNIDDIRALAYWESMIVESKTAKEKMVYMRLADEVKAKLLKDASKVILAHEGMGNVESIYSHPKQQAKKEPVVAPENVISLMERKKTGN